jgi:transcriptional regulator with XRE-family HTH domain
MVSNRYRLSMADSEYDERFPKRRSKTAAALASNCRRFRLKKKWTQGELAAAIKTQQTTITLIENGRANPTLSFLEKLAAALDVGLMDLFRARTKSNGAKE